MTKASVFTWASWIGTVSIACTIAVSFIASLKDLGSVAGLIALVCCWVLLSTRHADEYTERLWNAAASLAFASLLVMMIVMPFLEGVHAGITGSGNNGPTWSFIIGSAITAFYVGLLWKTVRGDI